MSVTITSYVPAYAGGDSVTLIAPNIIGGGGVSIGSYFVSVNDVLIGTGLGTFTNATMGDILSGAYVPPSGPAGFSYFELRAPVTAINAFDVNSNNIINVVDPVAAQDAATKQYVDTAVGSIGGPYLPLAGGIMTGAINAGAFIVSNVFDPASPQDAATKNYVDTEISALGLGAGTGPYLELAGGTMTGAIDAGALAIGNVLDPVAAQDAATMNYVDTEITALNLVGIGPYLALAGGIMAGAIDMTGSSINNLFDPVAAQDAATKNYVDTELAGADFLAITGGAMFGAIAMNGNAINNMLDPVIAQDAATKNYVDGFLPLAGGTMTGAIDAGGLAIGNVLDPVAAQDAATKNYVDTEVSSIGTGPFLELAGGTMIGGISMSANRIDSMQDPVNPQDAATKNYVDTEISTEIGAAPYLPIAGGTMGGSIDMSGSPITNMFGPPTGALDATNKAYVDSEISAAIIALNLGGPGPFLQIAGDAMAGDIIMGANNITFSGGSLTGLTTLTVGDHILGAADYQSGLGGDAFLIRTAAASTVSTPTYSFIGQPTTGMYTSTGDLRLSLGGSDRFSINATDIDVINSVLTNVGDPVNPQDAATKKYVDEVQSTKVLGSASVNLMATGSANIYTVPTGKMHIITHIIFKTTSVAGGGTDPDVSVGTQGVSPNNILPQTTMVLPVGVGADQGYYFVPVDGSVTPSAGTAVRVDVPVAGTSFTALVADVIIVGLEL